MGQGWFFDPVHARMLDFIQQAQPLETTNRILDVGCGTGRLLADAAMRWPQAQLTGVDPAEGMIAEARRLRPNTEFHLGPSEALPFPDGSFDGVCTSLSFHHWADQARGLAEICRVLRPGGWFCLADHTFPLGRLLGKKVRSARELRMMLEAAGMEVQANRGARFPFVAIILARKP
jgi:ubiquinone/menaquinone biosynthesis C-methylase UbiE